jgi:hypothetical protein
MAFRGESKPRTAARGERVKESRREDVSQFCRSVYNTNQDAQGSAFGETKLCTSTLFVLSVRLRGGWNQRCAAGTCAAPTRGAARSSRCARCLRPSPRARQEAALRRAKRSSRASRSRSPRRGRPVDRNANPGRCRRWSRSLGRRSPARSPPRNPGMQRGTRMLPPCAAAGLRPLREPTRRLPLKRRARPTGGRRRRDPRRFPYPCSPRHRSGARDGKRRRPPRHVRLPALRLPLPRGHRRLGEQRRRLRKRHRLPLGLPRRRRRLGAPSSCPREHGSRPPYGAAPNRRPVSAPLQPARGPRRSISRRPGPKVAAIAG